MESDIFFFGQPPSHRVPLCPLLNLSSVPSGYLLFLFSWFLTIVWAAVPLLSLSVFLALVHPPVVHLPILPSSLSSLCVLSALHFSASIFPALVFLFPASLSGSSNLLFYFFPDRPCYLMKLRRCRGQPVSPWWHDCLDCLLSCVPVLTDRLRLLESKEDKTRQEGEDKKGMKAGSHPAYPNCWWGCYKFQAIPHFLWSQLSITPLTSVNIGYWKYRLKKTMHIFSFKSSTVLIIMS